VAAAAAARHSIVDVLAFVGRVIELAGPLGLGSLGLQVNDLIGKGVHVPSSVGVALGEVVGLTLVTQLAAAVETIRNWSASRRRQSAGAGVRVRIFPGGVAGLFPRPDFGPAGLCDASVPPDDVRVEKGGCGSDVDGGGSASVSGADVGGRGVGLTVFTGSVESGWCACSLDLGAGKVVSFAGGAPITVLSTSTNPRMATTGSATTRPFRQLNGPKKGRPRTLR